jgi:Domain of unknown function (DUF5666)
MGINRVRLVWGAGFGAVLVGSSLAGFAQTQGAAQNMVSTATKSPAVSEPDQSVSEDTAIDPASLLPDLPSLPPAKATLVGGTIQKLDRVSDALTIQVFGGGRLKISFDPRTHIYLGTEPGSTADLHQGDRVYVDTILDGSTVFAKSIRLKNAVVAGESQGIVTSYRADQGELVLRDVLSPRLLKVSLTPQTSIMQGDHPAPASELMSGTLVAVKFGPQPDGRDVARQISVLAVPGSDFTFVGRVTSLDLRLGLLVITSATDKKTYEIHFDPSLLPPDENLRQSAQVTVLTRFDGNGYVARSMTVNSRNQQ